MREKHTFLLLAILLKPYSIWLARSPTKATRRIYRQTVLKWLEFWNDRPVDEASEADLIAFRDRLAESLAPGTVAGHLIRLKAFLSWAHREGLATIASAVLEFPVRKESVAASRRYLSTEHAIAIVEAADEGRDRLLLSCLLRLGIRNAEVRGLTWGDLHYDRLSVRGKGGKVRSIRLDGELLAELQAYRGERRVGEASPKGNREPIFQSKSGRHLIGNDVSRIVAAATRRARQKDPSIPPNVTPHWFRHSIATRAIAAGRNVREVQQYLGHASAKTTLDIYAHAVSDRPLWE